jgi:hypothetical protein
MRIKQIWFQIFYRFHKRRFHDSQEDHFGAPLIFLREPLKASSSFKRGVAGNQFCFLNLSHTFQGRIDWNWNDHGKLWIYHLNYFEFLRDKDFPKETGEDLIAQYYSARNEINDGMEPYPISLRGINWIKFFCNYNIHSYDTFLYDQYLLLRRSLEYHLFGNHLLENAISLAFAAIYFDQKEWGAKAINILQLELDEQILEDGGHFELSPMYHSIVLTRLADLYSLLLSNPVQAAGFHIIIDQLIPILSAMGSWLSTFKFSSGDLAWVNDSSVSMMPASADEILEYINSLGIEFAPGALKSSGYRRINTGTYEILIDIGAIGPDYQPGHAHADSLNFVLNWMGTSLIVDTGISTYEANDTRRNERSTKAHNTISYCGQNSSDVWASFRVGRRAKTKITRDTPTQMSAIHSGFQHLGIEHSRTWMIDESTLSIKDELIGSVISRSAQLYFHFPYHLSPEIENNQVILPDVVIKFSSKNQIEVLLVEYEQALEFNRVEKAQMVVVHFMGIIKTTFTLAS